MLNSLEIGSSNETEVIAGMTTLPSIIVSIVAFLLLLSIANKNIRD